jgi:hypothetical protein
VLRPSSLSRALAGLAAAALVPIAALGMVSTVPTGSPAYAANGRPPDPTQPLLVEMRSITPDYIPAAGPIVITGTVTNESDEEWTAINVEGFVGSLPITTTAELAAAAETPVSADVGHRIADPGTFDHVDSLLPGETVEFTLALPRSKLEISTAGVYWFGVHALGTDSTGRSTAGRDRTFLPLVPPAVANSGQVEQTSLVLPVRAAITRGPDGAIEDVDTWLHSLRSGALHDVVATGRAAQSRPITWVVDPAVVDAVRRLAEGNPPRTLVAPTTRNPDDNPSGDPSASASASGAGDSTSDEAPTADPSEVAAVAHRWLRRLHQVLSPSTAQVMGLPYGDLEIDSVVRFDRPLLVTAVHRTGHTLAPWGVPLGPVVAPPAGRMAGVTVADLPRTSTVLLEDSGLRGPAPAAATVNDHRVVFSSSGAAAGGPGPVDPLSPLALRQRVLSEAALRLLDDQQPLVVQVPTEAGTLGADFFTGLDVPWLRLSTLDTATAGPDPALSGARLRTAAPDDPFGPDFYSVADDAIEDGATLQSVLIGNQVLRRQIFDETASNASYSAAEDPIAALARVRSTSTWLTTNLGGVDLAAPEKVTLASANGHFSALVSNELDVPVTVRVRAATDSQIEITGGEKVQLAPHGRTSVLLSASTHVLGVHSVTLELTNQVGTPLGATDTFPMRAEAVSRLIWVILGAGVVLLFGAIVVRLVRRVLRSRTS